MIQCNEGFILRKVGENAMVVAVGEQVVTFSAMLKLSESGEMLFALLQKGAAREELVHATTERYAVDEQTAQRDVDAFVDQLLTLGVAKEV